MISLTFIRSIAKYERKTLLRSWFFRVFAILFLLFMAMVDVGTYTSSGGMRWVSRAIAGYIPLLHVFFLNITQSIVLVFLASDFFRMDKKLDTTEVVYIRPMSNADYVLGKFWGSLTVFLAFDVVVLLMAFIFNLLIPDTAIPWMDYVRYLVVLIIPSLVFVCGLTFMTMALFRNQAATYIVVIGFLILSMTWIKDAAMGIFDPIGFQNGLLRSDIVGWAFPGKILLWRMGYLMIGLAGLVVAIWRLRRLPQQRTIRVMLPVAALACLLTGAFLLWKLYAIQERGVIKRTAFMETYGRYEKSPLVMDACSIDLTHKGTKINCKVKLKVTNGGSEPLEELAFFLNPGLEVDQLSIGGTQSEFKRDNQAIVVRLTSPLPGKGSLDLELAYQGTPDGDICYPEYEVKVLRRPYWLDVVSAEKTYGFVRPNYVLLTSEMLWYPQMRGPVFAESKLPQARTFTSFNLKVHTKEGLQAISQGKRGDGEGNVWSFTPEKPLPRISLTVGAYESYSLISDSVDYAVYFYKGNDFFAEPMALLKDTLPHLVDGFRKDIERKYGLDYPFPRFSLVEVPVQFQALARTLDPASQMVQPEMVFYPERGVFLREASFKAALRHMKRGNQEEMSEMDKQISLLNRLVSSTLNGSANNWYRYGNAGEGVHLADYNLFPNLYAFVYSFDAPQWPMLDAMVEKRLATQTVTRDDMRNRMRGGLTDSEIGNSRLKEKSFQEVLNEGDSYQLEQVLGQKSNELWTRIAYKVGEEAFDSFLKEALAGSQFKSIRYDDFECQLRNTLGVNLSEEIDPWLNKKGLPRYLIKDVEVVRFQENMQELYQLRFKIANLSEVDGLITTSLRLGEGGFGGMRPGGGRGGKSGGFMGGDSEKTLWNIPGKTAFEIGMILEEPVRMMNVNTLTSENIPSERAFFFQRVEEKPHYKALNGVDTIPLFERADTEALVVDNEDPGFESFSPKAKSKLKQMLKMKEEEHSVHYSSINPWWQPNHWQPVAHLSYYGDYILSAEYIRSGDGSSFASWKTMIPKNGYYDVYVHIPKRAMRGRPGRGEGSAKEFKYAVHHDDGVDEIEIQVKNAEDGWNSLGSYYFSKDTAKVVLTNESSGKLVVADAVKWVKQE